MTWLVIHTPLYGTDLRKWSTVVGAISFAFSASFSTIYLWWKIREPTPRGGRNQKWKCSSSWQFSALFMIVMLELIQWDERRQTYRMPFCHLFSHWIFWRSSFDYLQPKQCFLFIFFIILVLSSLSIHLLDKIFILTSVLYSVCKTQERRCVLYCLKIVSWCLSDAEGNDLKLLVKKLSGTLGNSPKGRGVGETQGMRLLSRGSVQFSSVARSCPNLCDPMDRSTPFFPVHH